MKIFSVNKIITSIFIFFIILTQAQISEGGLPYSFHKNNFDADISFVKMPKVDNEILCKQEIPDKTGGFQFGKEFDGIEFIKFRQMGRISKWGSFMAIGYFVRKCIFH